MLNIDIEINSVSNDGKTVVVRTLTPFVDTLNTLLIVGIKKTANKIDSYIEFPKTFTQSVPPTDTRDYSISIEVDGWYQYYPATVRNYNVSNELDYVVGKTLLFSGNKLYLWNVTTLSPINPTLVEISDSDFSRMLFDDTILQADKMTDYGEGIQHVITKRIELYYKKKVAESCYDHSERMVNELRDINLFVNCALASKCINRYLEAQRCIETVYGLMVSHKRMRQW